MKMIIGLGNPGVKYLHNRHNVGHMLINKINKSSNSIKAVKTNTFMNDSGGFVKKNAPKDLNDLYIAHDDLDIKFGQYKIQFGIGPKVHNGIASVEDELGTKDFWRIRIGIDNRPTTPTASRAKGEDYVLEDFTKEELEILKQVQDDIGDELCKNWGRS